ncbi:MAG: NADH:ubiquinone reductase (Na(+)-transporting) subunit C [Flavobacterium sp.]
MNKEGKVYTILFITILVVIVGASLAFVATALKPEQDANMKKEKMQNILNSFGVTADRSNSEKLYAEFIKQEIVLDVNGEILKGEKAFTIDLAKEKTKFPLFIAEKEGKKTYIIPARGMGLWDAIWCYVSLDENLKVSGIVFDHKAETPGLGAEIKEGFFTKRFIGEDIFNASNALEGLQVIKGYKGGEDKTDGEVDGISGATLTCNGVTEMLTRGLSPYEKYLKTLKK